MVLVFQVQVLVVLVQVFSSSGFALLSPMHFIIIVFKAYFVLCVSVWYAFSRITLAQ